MTTTQQLREKINESCPELLELEFGCEVYVSMPDYELGTVLWGECVDCKQCSPMTEECYDEEDGCSLIEGCIVQFGHEEDGFWRTFVKHDEIKEILGIPPSLEHLLRAIKQKTMYVTVNIAGDGTAISTDKTDVLHYDLTKPPLEQTSEVQEQLLELLT